MSDCTCYPGGFTPDTYEGPQEDCPEHGEYDPTDEEQGGLPASWAASRAAVKVNPALTDGLD